MLGTLLCGSALANVLLHAWVDLGGHEHLLLHLGRIVALHDPLHVVGVVELRGVDHADVRVGVVGLPLASKAHAWADVREDAVALAAMTAAPDGVKSLRVDRLGVELRHVRCEAVIQSLELCLVWQNVSQGCHIFSATKLGLQRLVIDGLRDVAQLVSLLALQARLAHMLVVGDFVAYKWTCSLVD